MPNGGNSQCSIQLDGPYTGDNDVDVTLSEDNSTGGRVNIDEPMDFTLPANKDPVPFALTGIIASEAVDDVLLTVRDPENLWAGEAKATVYDLVSPQVTLSDLTTSRKNDPTFVPHPYQIMTTDEIAGSGLHKLKFGCDANEAISIDGSATLVPTGVTGPRLDHSMLAICQNETRGIDRTLFQDHRQGGWTVRGFGAALIDGTKVPVDNQEEVETPIPWSPDGYKAGVYPITYTKPVPPGVVALRGNRDGLVTCHCTDGPFIECAPEVPKAFGRLIGYGKEAIVLEVYSNPLFTIDSSYSDWLVVYEVSNPQGTIQKLAEASWKLNVSSNTNGEGAITPTGSGPPVDKMMVTGNKVANDYQFVNLNDIKGTGGTIMEVYHANP